MHALLAWFQTKKVRLMKQFLRIQIASVFCYSTSFYISAFIVFRMLKVHCNDTLKKNSLQLFIISL